MSQKVAVDNVVSVERNPLIDPGLVEKHRLLEEELHRLGVSTKPHFGIAPALGATTQVQAQQSK